MLRNNNIICRNITDCRLECAPWSKYFVKSENPDSRSESNISFQKYQNSDKKVSNWIENQISSRSDITWRSRIREKQHLFDWFQIDQNFLQKTLQQMAFQSPK